MTPMTVDFGTCHLEGQQVVVVVDEPNHGDAAHRAPEVERAHRRLELKPAVGLARDEAEGDPGARREDRRQVSAESPRPPPTPTAPAPADERSREESDPIP